MKRRAVLYPTVLVPVAVLALCAMLVCFYPRSALSLLFGDGAAPRALTVSADGQVLDCADGDALLAALADSACVRLPGLPPIPDAGEIRLCCGDTCAVISPRGGYLRSAGGSSYLIMNAGPELYQRVRTLVTLHA